MSNYDSPYNKRRAGCLLAVLFSLIFWATLLTAWLLWP